MSIQTPASALKLDELKTRVEEVLTTFLAAKRLHGAAQGRPDLVTPIQQFLDAGGKRLRPVLALVGWHAAGANGDPGTAFHLAACLELFHAFALIHDDVMDHSDTRRGRPTIHQAFARHRPPPATEAQAGRFGEGAAILIGDLALIWSDEVLRAGRPTTVQLSRMLPLLDEMRTEVTYGQFLDLQATGTPNLSVEAALTIIRYKTAKYTIERPLQLGAALAGADDALLQALSAFALPLGEAFQLRDDLLGVFGDPAAMGKPALDDLREGKATVLIALALERADHAQAAQLRLLLGDRGLTEEQAATARRLIAATGADRKVEGMITERYDQALLALEKTSLAPAAAHALRHLADSAVRRRT
ncbi:polyprenyl synthetase family protein [Streptomyces vinaceus]